MLCCRLIFNHTKQTIRTIGIDKFSEPTMTQFAVGQDHNAYADKKNVLRLCNHRVITTNTKQSLFIVEQLWNKHGTFVVTGISITKQQ